MWPEGRNRETSSRNFDGLLRVQATRLRLWLGRLLAGTIASSCWLLIELIPERFALRIASPFGRFLRRGTERQIIESMRRVLGPYFCEERKWAEVWRSHAEHTALMVIEVIHLHRLPIGEVHRRIILEGEQHLRDSLKSNRGVMLFINHLGNMACTVGGLAIHGYDVTLAGNRIWIPFIERKLFEIHRRVGADRLHLGKQLAWTAAKVFRRNGIFATFIDFSVTRKHNAWLEFGQAEMSVSLAPAIMALRNDAALVCASCVRMTGNRHRVIIHPPLLSPNTGDLLTDATALMQDAMRLLHADLLRRPEQWWPWDKVHLRLREQAPESSTREMVGAEQLQA